MTDLLDKVARLACWRGPVELSQLKGGLTNISFVATYRGERFVVRCGEDIAVHHVFRDRERAASVAAFEAGLSPEIIHVELGIMVLRFIDGRTLTEDDLRANIGRLLPLLKDCHVKVGHHVRGPVNAFWVFHVIRDYVALLNGDRPYLEWASRFVDAQVPLHIVLGHNGRARPALEPVDGAFDFLDPLRRQRQAGELAEFLANLRRVVWIEAIAARTVAGLRGLPAAFQRDRDADRLRGRHRLVHRRILGNVDCNGGRHQARANRQAYALARCLHELATRPS
jgi:hypothetical protein